MYVDENKKMKEVEKCGIKCQEMCRNYKSLPPVAAWINVMMAEVLYAESHSFCMHLDMETKEHLNFVSRVFFETG